MVTGFEDITFELTKFEKETIVPIVYETWKKKSPESITTAKEMISGVNAYCMRKGIFQPGKGKKTYKLNGPRLRKVVHYLRVSGKLPNLIANSKGYFITNDKEKIREFIKGCRQKANSFMEVASRVEYYNFVNNEQK